jgi:Icc-related predicted phosphoesterase
MKFDILSDIHLSYTQFNRKIPMTKYFPDKTGSDYLLIAGDLGEDIVGNETAKKFLTKASKLYKKVFVVLGNHDYWHTNEDSSIDERKLFDTIPEEFAKFVKSFDKSNKIVFLQNEGVRVEDVWIYGTTLWSDIPPTKYWYIQRCMNDYYCIYKREGSYAMPITYFETTKANFVAFNKLQDFVSLHRKDKVIVLTHHSPSFQSRSNNPKYDDAINYAYMNNYDTFILENPNIKLWCHGHIHEAQNYFIGGTRIISNPLGYVGNGEYAERHYDGKTIENWHLTSVTI